MAPTGQSESLETLEPQNTTLWDSLKWTSTAPLLEKGLEQSPAAVYIYVILLCLTTVVGNIGNTFVIGAVIVDKRLWREGNIFIVNLAIADLCVTGKHTY